MSNYKGIFLIPLFLVLLNPVYANGLLNSFKELASNQRAAYLKEIQNHVNQDFNINTVKNIQEIKVSPTFLKLIMLHTPHRYFKFIQNDKCSLYDLLNTKLINFTSNDYKQIVFSFEDTKGIKQKRSLTIKDFLEKIAYKQCPNVRTIQKYFTLDNLRKTLSQIKLVEPTNSNACKKEILDFSKDVKSPYLCSISEEIKNAKKLSAQLNNSSQSDFQKRSLLNREIKRVKALKKILSPKALSLLRNRCENLDSPKKYCTDFFKKGIWNRLLTSKKLSSINDFYCSGTKTKECIRERNVNEHSCNFPNDSRNFLLPLPDCSLTSSALTYSRFKLDISDCPANVGNDALTSFGRLLKGFEKSSQYKSCELNSIMPFINFDEKYSALDHWDISLCYLNPLLDNKKICMKTVFGDVAESKYSLGKNMTTILSKLKGYNSKVCQVINSSDYKPALLQFKNGCYIVTESEGCKGTNCNFKVMLGESEFKKYTLESNLNFNLVPFDFLNEKNALIHILERRAKKSLKQIKSISSFKFTFDKFPNAVFMGIGCLEDILPRYYKSKTLNQCHYMPFIVDGIIEDRDIYSLTIRTSLDHVHAPRIVPWKNIFSAVKNFQLNHPTKLWSLNAFY